MSKSITIEAQEREPRAVGYAAIVHAARFRRIAIPASPVEAPARRQRRLDARRRAEPPPGALNGPA